MSQNIVVASDDSVFVFVVPEGPAGEGLAPGGSMGQVLAKASAADFDADWVTLTKASVGLSLVDNTSDVNKPVSTAQQSALDGKVPVARQVAGHPLSADVTVSKSDVGLSNVDNTSDANKPVSTAQAAADAATLATATGRAVAFALVFGG